MKRLLLLLLLASPAYAQVYSQMAIQNTTGNWLKASPGALVYLCSISTTSNNCLAGIGTVPLYTDQTLTATTPNPITADGNGNYTLFATTGLYLQCIKAITSFCQDIQVGGGQNFLLRTNSPNGTVQNELVMYDTGNLDSNSVATVQTAAVGTKGVIGVCISGCGTSGIATIGTYLAAQCIGDGAYTVGDLVAASPTNPGQCNDYGASINANVQTVGRVSKANAGLGTAGQVDFFLGDLTGPGSTNGSGTVSNCGTPGGIAYYVVAGSTVGCDPNATLDGNGNETLHSLTANDVSHAGYINLIQGAAAPAAPANGVQLTVGSSVTGYTLKPPSAAGTGCVQAANAAGVVTLSFTGSNCGAAGAGASSFFNSIATVPDSSGNVGWTVQQLTGSTPTFFYGHWEWVFGAAFGGTDTVLTARFKAPHTIPSGTAKIIFECGNPEVVSGHTMTFKEGDRIESTSINPGGNPTYGATQNFTTSTTAYAPTVLSFTVNTAPTADQVMDVWIDATAESGLTQNVQCDEPVLQWQ